MIKYSLFTAILLLTLTSCANKEINYVDIPRTRVSIQPPANYVLSNSISGLESSEGSMISVNEIDGGNFYNNTRTFSRASFELHGMKVFSFIDTIIDGYHAKIMSTNTDTKDLYSYSLIFGDSTFSVSIMALFNPKFKNEGENIKKSLISVKYHKNKKTDPFEKARFQIDTTHSVFKFKIYAHSTYMYGVDHIDTTEKTLVMLQAQGIGPEDTMENLSKISFNGLEKHGLIGLLEDTIISDKINGCKALTTLADGYYGTKKTFVYQQILTKNDYVVIIVGLCDFDHKERIKEIGKFAKSLKIPD